MKKQPVSKYIVTKSQLLIMAILSLITVASIAAIYITKNISTIASEPQCYSGGQSVSADGVVVIEEPDISCSRQNRESREMAARNELIDLVASVIGVVSSAGNVILAYNAYRKI